MKDLINSAPIQQREINMSIFPDIAYKCSFTFKGGYDIDVNNLQWYGFWVNFVICICISDLD